MVHGGGSRGGGRSTPTRSSNNHTATTTTNTPRPTSSGSGSRNTGHVVNTPRHLGGGGVAARVNTQHDNTANSPSPIVHGRGSRNTTTTRSPVATSGSSPIRHDTSRTTRTNNNASSIHHGSGTRTTRNLGTRHRDDRPQRPLYNHNHPRATTRTRHGHEETSCCCGPDACRQCGLFSLICGAVIGCLAWCFVPCRRSRLLQSTFPLVLGTIILASFLVILSGQSDQFTLNAGESRQIVTSWWTRAVSVQVISEHTSVDVSLYAFSNQCPALTGPFVEVDTTNSMDFDSGDYHYDYFYLNRGSQVAATLSQTQGNGITYLLRGQDRVSILENHPDEEQLENLLLTALQSWKTNDRQSQDTVARFRAPNNDFYVLLYDNPYNTPGHMHVDLNLDLTTYDLKNDQPICNNLVFHDCGRVQTRGIHCFLVDTTGHAGEQVTLQIHGYRNFTSILLLSSIPAVLWFVWVVWTCVSNLCTRGERQPLEQDPNLAEPFLPSRDPPTAPPSAAFPARIAVPPSAPPTEEDAIPMAEAQIIHPISPSDVSPARVIPMEAPAAAAETLGDDDKSSSAV